jgi:catechol-2,3-dioxygenase
MTTVTPPKVGHIARAARDPHGLAEFYRDLLDLRIVREVGNRLAGDSVLLSGHPEKEDHELVFITKPESTHTAFRVDSVETLSALYDRARGRGIAVPYALDNGIARSFFVRDPEGNAIEVYLATREPLRGTPPLADPEAIDRLMRSPTA